MRTPLAALAVACAMGCSHMNDGNALTATGGAPTEMLEAIRADAAARTGVAASAVTIDSVRSVTWRDASLGCPNPGAMYAQVLVPGWRVQMSAGGQRLDYHAGQRGHWTWCPAGHAQDPLPSSTI